MDHSLVIFDSGDEMIFTPEPPANNSNIHFQIHRSEAEAITVSEEHYQILNDIFGTPAFSPDPDEDMLTSNQLGPTPENEFQKTLTMETELSFEDEGQEDQLLSNPKTPTRPQDLVFTDFTPAFSPNPDKDMPTSSQLGPTSENEFQKTLTMETELFFEDEEHED